ncbi:unnamed protein product [Brassicogethes aeneus]|uniref:Gamma-tubulin complex component n=1 Tax=Brassicogethes aeneus TaxID=1431903 RepID=A0A9P0AU88_BRAAE|nr:unnamed protein product [Brassicogethes aeneus]
MSKLSEDIKIGLVDLIKHVSGLDEGNEKFVALKRHFTGVIKKSDYMYFSSNKEINDNIQFMSDKYLLHGFFAQAEDLKAAYSKYLTPNLSKSECQNRLNNVKFLLGMSENPTKYFFDNPDEFIQKKVENVDNINWKEYLNEGIEKWEPDFNDSSESYSSDESTNFTDEILQVTPLNSLPIITETSQDGIVTDLRLSRDELLANIQHSWYKSENNKFEPQSEWREANIGILWERHLDHQVEGLIPLPKSKILSEYKVIREILFQIWSMHNSVVFEINGDKIKVKKDVTISSVRSMCFENFMGEFVPHIELMEEFRDFFQSTDITSNCPCTYRSYSSSLKKIINPVYKKIVELEDLIRKQDSTYTLLKLADDLSVILEPMRVLKRIHQKSILNQETEDFLTCSTSLISNLHGGLQLALNKADQDLRLTIFVETLHHYLQIVNCWLVQDIFDEESDLTREFIIENKNDLNITKNPSHRNVDFTLNFEIRRGEFLQNGLLKILAEKVLKIGRNIQLLRMLGKYDVVEFKKETIYDEFVRRSLEAMCKFYKVDFKDVFKDNVVFHEEIETFKFPVIPCEGNIKNVTEMDKLEYLVDTSDGFLMKAFEEFFIEQTSTEITREKTLFEKISQITTQHLLPINNFFEKVLHNILKERFTVSGLMVKNVLIEKYNLYKEITFLWHIFLFHDDIIFPFYRKLFKKMNYSRNWGNEIWLTSNLHDVLVDTFPDFYAKCSVATQESWQQCANSLDCCRTVEIKYAVEWPNNLIVSHEQMRKYEAMFKFLLRLKWGLHTLNHLSFEDLEPKKSSRGKSGCKKLQMLRFLKFCLINLMNTVQHFVFGFVIRKGLMNFELEFEKSTDLNSIRKSHENFVDFTYEMILMVINAEENKYGFNSLLLCVKALHKLWHNTQHVSLEKLKECQKVYVKSYKVLDPVINPVYIFDY